MAVTVRATGRAVQRPDVRVHGSAKTCVFWLQGKCSRNPCRFMHRDSPPTNNSNLVFVRDPTKTHCLNNVSTLLPRKISYKGHNKVCKSEESTSDVTLVGRKRQMVMITDNSIVTEESNTGASLKKLRKIEESSSSDVDEKSQHVSSACSSEDVSSLSTEESTAGENVTPRIKNKRVCEHWISGDCVHGDECSFHHSWFLGDDFAVLAKLEGGPTKAITGIALPEGSDKLYSCSIDGTAQVWDCHTGQCTSTRHLGNHVGSSICEGLWVFVGMPNVVLAWNTQSDASFHLNGLAGQVHAMVFMNDTLFAGDQDGVILAWKCSFFEANPFQLATSYRGHTSSVTCLTADERTVYSGSADHTVRMWDLETSVCTTLIGHTDVVMSMLCWEGCLISCSLDKTIKAWAYEQGSLEAVYTHQEEHGVITLDGMFDAQGKPILFCSCNDNSVRLYDLPSFNERGRMFSRAPVGVIKIDNTGLVFTGDTSGSLTVWKYHELN